MNDTNEPMTVEQILDKSPIDKEVPDDIWETIHATWTGLWTDGYGEWDERQPSDIYPVSELLSEEAKQRLVAAINALIEQRERAARVDELINMDQETRSGKGWIEYIQDRIAQLKKGIQ